MKTILAATLCFIWANTNAQRSQMVADMPVLMVNVHNNFVIENNDRLDSLLTKQDFILLNKRSKDIFQYYNEDHEMYLSFVRQDSQDSLVYYSVDLSFTDKSDFTYLMNRYYKNQPELAPTDKYSGKVKCIDNIITVTLGKTKGDKEKRNYVLKTFMLLNKNTRSYFKICTR